MTRMNTDFFLATDDTDEHGFFLDTDLDGFDG